jgi:hypothetical protein
VAGVVPHIHVAFSFSRYFRFAGIHCCTATRVEPASGLADANKRPNIAARGYR